MDLSLFAPATITTIHTDSGKHYEVFHPDWRDNKISRAPTCAKWTKWTGQRILGEPFVASQKDEHQGGAKIRNGKQAVESHIKHATHERIEKINQTIQRLDQELRALGNSIAEGLAAPHVRVTQSRLIEFCRTRTLLWEQQQRVMASK